jgi:hypothetical protein
MRSILAGITRLAAILAVCVFVQLRSAAAESQWIALLEANDFSKHWETTGNWSIKEGVATLTPRPGERGWERWGMYLWSKEKFQDFEIQFDYKVQSRGNSGFYFHVGDKNDPVRTGIEVQIYDSAGKAQGAKLTDHDSGGVIPSIPPTKNAAKAAGEWNSFHITCKGRDVTIRLNDETVNEFSLDQENLKDRPWTGYIGFQDHGLPLSLRNIKIRTL